MTRRVENQTLSLTEVIQAPRLTPLSLNVVKIIQASVSLEKKDALGAASLITGRRIILIDKVKEAVMVEINLQL